MTAAPERSDVRLGYRALWWTVAWVVGLAGAFVVSASQPVEGLLVGGAAMLACAVAVLLMPGWSWSQAPPDLAWTIVAVAVAVAWAVMGVLLIAGTYGLLISVLIAATAPPLVTRLIRTFRFWVYWSSWSAHLPTPDRHHQQGDVGSGSGSGSVQAAPGLLSHTDLCRAWRTSYLTLQRLQLTGDLVSQTAVITARQGYLDELERRDPAGFERWLAADAQPASDPSDFIPPPSAQTADGTLT